MIVWAVTFALLVLSFNESCRPLIAGSGSPGHSFSVVTGGSTQPSGKTLSEISERHRLAIEGYAFTEVLECGKH